MFIMLLVLESLRQPTVLGAARRCMGLPLDLLQIPHRCVELCVACNTLLFYQDAPPTVKKVDALVLWKKLTAGRVMTNSRLIQLQDGMLKLLKSIIADRILQFVRPYLYQGHHGGLPRRSTYDLLSIIINLIHQVRAGCIKLLLIDLQRLLILFSFGRSVSASKGYPFQSS